MNVNSEIQQLQVLTGLDVSPDEYTGSSDKYIVYNYTDERPCFWGDDGTMCESCIINVNLYTPPKFNYMALKNTIIEYLETIGILNEVSSWVGTYTNKNNLELSIRQTTFNVTITKER